MSIIHNRSFASCLLWLSVAGAGVVLNGCAHPITVQAASDPSASFASYRTFSFGAVEPPVGSSLRYGPSSTAAETERRLARLIADGLALKGYALAPRTGDIVVRFASGRGTLTVHESSAGGEDEFRGGYQAKVTEPLVIEVFDSASGVRVWHGSAEVAVSSDRVDPVVLQRLVSGLLASFPSQQIAVR